MDLLRIFASQCCRASKSEWRLDSNFLMLKFQMKVIVISSIKIYLVFLPIYAYATSAQTAFHLACSLALVLYPSGSATPFGIQGSRCNSLPPCIQVASSCTEMDTGNSKGNGHVVLRLRRGQLLIRHRQMEKWLQRQKGKQAI